MNKEIEKGKPMNDFNICIVRPPDYIWSSCFMELAELIAFSIKDLGLSVSISENGYSSSRNIVIGSHLLNKSMADLLPKHSIIFNTEPVGDSVRTWNENALHFLGRFEAWDYSKRNISILGSLGIKPPKLFKFGYHKELERIHNKVEKDIDILFYGTMTPERQSILNGLEKARLKVVKLNGVFGAERDSFIARSKIILNLHQYDTKDLEIVRCHYLMNKRKAIVSQCDAETNLDPDYRGGLILTPYDNVISSCLSAISSPVFLVEQEKRALETIKKLDSVQIIKDLIA